MNTSSSYENIRVVIKLRHRIRWLLTVVCIGGMLAFGYFFLMTFSEQPKIESAVKAFMVDHVESEISTQFGFSDLPNPSLFVDSLVGDLPLQASVKEYSVVGRHQIKEIYVRKLIEAENGIENSWDNLRRMHIQANYKRIFKGFISEFRTFTAINGIFFALAFGLLFCLTTSDKYFLKPVAVLVITNCIAIIVYVITQDWFTSILTQNFLGFWYLFYLALAALFLTDIVCNEGRIISMILSIRRFWHYF